MKAIIWSVNTSEPQVSFCNAAIVFMAIHFDADMGEGGRPRMRIVKKLFSVSWRVIGVMSVYVHFGKF